MNTLQLKLLLLGWSPFSHHASPPRWSVHQRMWTKITLFSLRCSHAWPCWWERRVTSNGVTLMGEGDGLCRRQGKATICNLLWHRQEHYPSPVPAPWLLRLTYNLYSFHSKLGCWIGEVRTHPWTAIKIITSLAQPWKCLPPRHIAVMPRT